MLVMSWVGQGAWDFHGHPVTGQGFPGSDVTHGALVMLEATGSVVALSQPGAVTSLMGLCSGDVTGHGFCGRDVTECKLRSGDVIGKVFCKDDVTGWGFCSRAKRGDGNAGQS